MILYWLPCENNLAQIYSFHKVGKERFGNSTEDLRLPQGALGLLVCTTSIDLQDPPQYAYFWPCGNISQKPISICGTD